MTVSTLKAGAGTLAHAAKMTGDAHDDFHAMAARLSSRLELHLAGWQGAGSTAFQQLHASWHEHHTRIAALLTELEAVFVRTEAGFDETDAAARRSIDGVAGTLAGRLG